MSRSRTVSLLAVLLVVLAGTALLWMFKTNQFHRFQRQDGLMQDRSDPVALVEQKEIPLAVHEEPVLLPSPPLPDVSEDSSQSERREAFELRESVDYIVRKDEPFVVGGTEWTIEEILNKLQERRKEPPYLLPSIEEKELGSIIRKPMATVVSEMPQRPAFYGVRVVRLGDNVWNIHHAVIREYLARRGIVLSVTADKPLPSGHSSGVGRLLKFIEGVVHVYNVKANRLERDLNMIHAEWIIVFFKISDLFFALDELEAGDLDGLRYVRGTLRLERAGGATDLLHRRAFLE